MNNEQKNTYVKEQITSALLKLLQEKNLEEISISELTEAACVGRVSFYRNFSGKEDVLKQESDRLMKEWGNAFEEMSDDEYKSFFLSLFDFYKANQSFYTTVCKSGLSNIVLQTILDTAQITPEMNNLEAYLKSFWAYGIFGWTIEWINRGMKESGSDLFNMFQVMQNGQQK